MQRRRGGPVLGACDRVRGLLELVIAFGPDLGLEADELVAGSDIAYPSGQPRRDGGADPGYAGGA